MKRKTCGADRGGFSLIEVAVATALVGLGVTALLMSLGAGTRANDGGRKVTQAVFIAQELREWTLRLPFSDPDPGDAGNPPGSEGSDPQEWVDDLDDLMDVTYSPPMSARGKPPLDATGEPMTGMNGWSQHITLTWLNGDGLTQTVSPGTSDFIRVQVDVAYRGQDVLTASWLVTRRD